MGLFDRIAKIMVAKINELIVHPQDNSLIVRPQDADSTKPEQAILEGERKTKSLRNDPVVSKLIKELEITSDVFFYFVDKQEIERLYNDFFHEPTVESLVNKVVKEVSGDVSASLPNVISAKTGGKSVSEWLQEVKLPGASLSEKFIRYLRAKVNEGEINFGIETIGNIETIENIKTTELQKFRNLIDELKKSYDIEIDSELISTKENEIKKGAAEGILRYLEQRPIKELFLMSASFTISDQADEYRFSYVHPVSSLIKENVTISFSLIKDSIDDDKSRLFNSSVGMPVPMKVFGKVFRPLNRNSGLWELIVIPLVVY